MNSFNTGKNPKWIYYLKSYSSLLIPDYFFQRKLNSKLEKAKQRDDYQKILARVDYYNKLNLNYDIKEGVKIKNFKLKDAVNKVYFFDSYEYLRYFNPAFRFSHEFGDITYIPKKPSILKSRPVAGNNHNSILLKLNKVRHFIKVTDQLEFQDKENKLFFRGKVGNKKQRELFFKMYFNHPMCNLGDTDSRSNGPKAWKTPKTNIYNFLNYKFILAIEGNDVGSNLKWVMSSNSIAVMPKPTYETWFMEGQLLPNIHYIEIKPDFSDLEEKLNYYINHPLEAEQIITNANNYVKEFWDKDKEDIISLLVLKKYFEKTNQM